MRIWISGVAKMRAKRDDGQRSSAGGEPHAAHKRPHISFAPRFWAAPSTNVTAPVGVVELPVSAIVRVTYTTQVTGLADVLSAILIWSNCAISPVVPAVRTLKLQVRDSRPPCSRGFAARWLSHRRVHMWN
jgi:hypothetical protein